MRLTSVRITGVKRVRTVDLRRGRWTIAIIQLTALVAVLLCVSPAPAWSLEQSPGQSADASVPPFTVSGKVVNGLTGAVIPRALVTLNNRNALTNALGVFTFQQFTAATGSISATKPGFAQNRLPGSMGVERETVDTTTHLELKLFPDGLITGTVVGADGLALERVAVTIERRLPNAGEGTVTPVGFTQTDSHGSYRFEEPPGEYRLHLGYSPRTGNPGEVMLPLDYPEQGAEEKVPMLKVETGQETRVALRPRIGRGYEVALKFDRSSGSGQGGRILVTTAQGLSFNAMPQNGAGGASTLQLPTGSYHLRALQQDRSGQMEADTQVTVSDHPVGPLELRFTPQPQIPVELVLDPPATGTSPNASPPTLAQINVRLEQAGTRSDSFTPVVRLGGDNRLGSGTVAVSPGTYRLRGGGGSWFVRAASYGTVDLLRNPLVVGPSGSGEPIRLFCSNHTGMASVSVRLNGVNVPGWIYFLARQPTLTALDVSRSYSGTSLKTLPPGRYTVLALDQQFGGDLMSAPVLEKIKDAPTVDIAEGQTTEVDLKLQPAESLQ